MDEERKAMLGVLQAPMCAMYAMSLVCRISKFTKRAQEKKEEGNQIFRLDHHDSSAHEFIFRKYSHSISVAEKDSEELAEAYGNRSALLLHLLKYEDCLIDIKRAFSITKSTSFKCRLLCRQVACLVALGSPDAETTLEEAKVWMSRSEKKQDLMKFIDKAETKIKESHSVAEEKRNFNREVAQLVGKVNDFSSVKVQYSPKYGNHIIALRDIQPGEVVFLEKPFVIAPSCRRAEFYCSHCFLLSWTAIPCDGCSRSMFCSEKCKEIAWKRYHNIECPAYGYFLKERTDVDGVAQCSLRSLIIGVQEAGSIGNLRNELEIIDKGHFPEKLFKDSDFQTSSFKSLYSLCIKAKVDDEQIFSSLPDAALRLVVALAKHTNFFGRVLNVVDYESFAMNEDVIFIGSLILRLMKISLIIQRSVFNKSMHSTFHKAPEPDSTHLHRGFSISILSSLINHSCNPNVGRTFTEDNNVVIYALQPIKKGSQILECYLDGIYETSNQFKLEGYHNTFYEIAKEVRQEFLEKKFGIFCRCEACVEDWPALRPILKDLIKRKPDSYHKKLFRQSLEMKLFKSNRKIMNLAETSENAEYNERMLSKLSESIQEALDGGLPPVSILTWELITTLKRVFDRLHGGRLHIPDDSELR